jgi:hypothetical protein
MEYVYQLGIAWRYLTHDARNHTVVEDEADEPEGGWARWIAERVGHPGRRLTRPAPTAPARPSDAYLWGVHRPG